MKWYLLTDSELPNTTSVLLQERDGKIYEKHIVNDKGKSFKSSKDLLFHAGYSLERFEHYKKSNPQVSVKEITEGEVFTILL